MQSCDFSPQQIEHSTQKEEDWAESKFSTERGGEFLDAHEEEEEEYEDGIHGRRPGGEHRDVED